MIEIAWMLVLQGWRLEKRALQSGVAVAYRRAHYVFNVGHGIVLWHDWRTMRRDKGVAFDIVVHAGSGGGRRSRARE